MMEEYVDRANEEQGAIPALQQRRGAEPTFPERLHFALEQAGKDCYEDAISWQPHGRAFMVHDADKLTDRVLKLWFRQTKYASFQRQLNLYGFRRISNGPDRGGYYNDLFLRGKPFLAKRISRLASGGVSKRAQKGKEGLITKEPDFYRMAFVGVKSAEAGTHKPTKSLLELAPRESVKKIDAGGPKASPSLSSAGSTSQQSQDQLKRSVDDAVAQARNVLLLDAHLPRGHSLNPMSFRGNVAPGSTGVGISSNMFPGAGLGSGYVQRGHQQDPRGIIYQPNHQSATFNTLMALEQTRVFDTNTSFLDQLTAQNRRSPNEGQLALQLAPESRSMNRALLAQALLSQNAMRSSLPRHLPPSGLLSSSVSNLPNSSTSVVEEKQEFDATRGSIPSRNTGMGYASLPTPSLPTEDSHQVEPSPNDPEALLRRQLQERKAMVEAALARHLASKHSDLEGT